MQPDELDQKLAVARELPFTTIEKGTQLGEMFDLLVHYAAERAAFFGYSPFELTTDQIHLLDEESWTELTDLLQLPNDIGLYSLRDDMIYVRKVPSEGLWADLHTT